MNGASPSFSEMELTMALPWQHFSPASITLHLELSINQRHPGRYPAHLRSN